MRVTCNECGSKAVITKTNRLSLDAVDLYCSCGCGHRFVWSAGFKHTLTGSNREKSEVIKSLLVDMPEKEKRDLIHSLSGVCV